MAQKKFYVTTPIYYVTAKPHLGSLYSTLLADVLKRWHRLKGEKTFFLTGTDEHGQKIAQAAEKVGKEPKAFVDSFVPAYKSAWEMFDIDYDCFIRTTDDYHKKGAQHLVQQLLDKGDIYKDSYEGWYCVSCETFVTEKDAQKGTEAPPCPSCGRPTIEVSEETYFFRLSAYQEKLLEFYRENPDFVAPKERMNEMLSFVQAGLKDLSISRTTVQWGIPFPKDPKHIIYVWVEALTNYITAIGYGQPNKQKEFDFWWPADVQILGKDIVRFHGVFWPAFLMAAGLKLPKRLLVHGWIKIDKQKMSKSLGNVVDPVELHARYGTDPVRYYLCRQMAINQDGDFSISDLEQRISSDLANDLGNLLNRVVTLALKNNLVTIDVPKSWSEASMALRDESWNVVEDFENHMDDCMFHLALTRLWEFIHKANAYFHAHEPWKLAQKDQKLFLEVIAATCHSLRDIAHLLWPVMPKKMEQLLFSLGQNLEFNHDTIEDLDLCTWHHQFKLTQIPALFEKPEPTKEEIMEEKVTVPESHITIDDVVKVELRVGTITECEIVEKSDKLLRMQVDFGDLGVRQILAGVREYYQPEDLAGKQAVFVTNLKPRKMMGMESQGMMLVTDSEGGKKRVVQPSEKAPNGSRLT